VFIGRKTSLYVAVLLCYVANIVMMTTTNMGGLYAGRLIIGLGNGFLMTFSQLYIQVLVTIYLFGLHADNRFKGKRTGEISRPDVGCLSVLDVHRLSDRHHHR